MYLIIVYQSIKLDGTKNSIEETTPMHVKDVVQMLNTPTEVTSGKGTALLQSCAFIFGKKYNGINDHVKYKARLVAHGYRQVYGTDYWETYAPVSSSRAIRALLTLAASHKMIIHLMDVDTAFLNAKLQEEIYMIPPAGLTGIQP